MNSGQKADPVVGHLTIMGDLMPHDVSSSNFDAVMKFTMGLLDNMNHYKI